MCIVLSSFGGAKISSTRREPHRRIRVGYPVRLLQHLAAAERFPLNKRNAPARRLGTKEGSSVPAVEPQGARADERTLRRELPSQSGLIADQRPRLDRSPARDIRLWSQDKGHAPNHHHFRPRCRCAQRTASNILAIASLMDAATLGDPCKASL